MNRKAITIKNAPFNELFGIPYLAVLAYPSDVYRQIRFCYFAVAGYWKSLYANRIITRSEMPEKYKDAKNQTIVNTINLGIDRIKKERACAASAAMVNIKKRHMTDDEFGKHLKYSPHQNPKTRIFSTESFYQMHVDYGADIIPYSLEKFDKRMWRNSKPVLHLALALPMFNRFAIHMFSDNQLNNNLLEFIKNDLHGGFSYYDLLYDNSWAIASILLAELFRLTLPEFYPDLPANSFIQLKVNNN